MKYLLWLIVFALAACSTSNIKRDMDVSGSLPRAIGLGSFTPACVFLCFPTATMTQGDVLREEIVEGEPFVVHSSETVEKIKGNPPKAKKAPPPKRSTP